MLIQPRKSPGKKLRFNMLKSVHHYSRLVLTFGVAAFLAACSGSKRSEPEAADSTQSTNSGSAVRLTAQPAPNRTNETDEPASAGKKATIVTLTDANFSDSVLKSPIPVLVEFRAELASGSKMLAPVFDELSREYAGRVKFGRINAIEHEALNAEYGVREVPTLLMFKGGQVIGKLDGLKNKNDYISFLEKHLSTGSK
jgi:thioredoxin 1